MNIQATSLGNGASATAQENPAAIHLVRSGDTLWDIAKQYGVRLTELIAANPQIANIHRIYPGDEVRIPGAAASGTTGSAPATRAPPAGGAAGATPQVGANGRYTQVQLTQVFYQAGFRGENLVAMVAISMRESGGKPDAFNGNRDTRDLSYGLTQINMLGSLGEARRAQLGLTSNEQLFDPAVNARAAFVISNNGTDLTPWGGYKGRSNTYNTDMTAARAAVRQAQSLGLLDASAPPAPGAPAPAGSTTTPAAADGRVALGARGGQVREVQGMLRTLGYYQAYVGGTFGPQTDAAVRAFQRDHGLTMDGWAGPQTQAALRRAVNASPPPADGIGPRAATPATTPASGVEPVTDGPRTERIQAALDYGVYWATQTQEPVAYVGGASPYRFGGIGNGGRAQLPGQSTYLSPKGMVSFDCSGFVVAMYRQAGTDMQAQGIISSRSMASNLPAVGKSDLQPGDLLVKAGSHVVVYLGDIDGDGRPEIVESTPFGPNPRDGSAPVTGVRIQDAASFLNNGDYVGRRVVV